MAKTISNRERDQRHALMRRLRTWLSERGENQRWLATKLGIYHGYVSNLLTCKQLPSEEVCDRARRLMGRPLNKKKKRTVKKRSTRPSMPKRSARKRKSRQPVWKHVTFEEIDKIRKKWGFSKIAMAKYLGVTNSTYHNWKSGIAIPHAHEQKRIKRAIEPIPSPIAPLPKRSGSLSGVAARSIGDIVSTWIRLSPPGSLSTKDCTEMTLAVRKAITT